MAYTIAVELKDEPGAMARLVVLLNQRNLPVAHIGAHRVPPHRLEAVIGIDADPSTALWAIRQLRRLKGFIAAALVEPNAASSVMLWAEARVPKGLVPKADPEVAVAASGERADGSKVVTLFGSADAIQRWAAANGIALTAMHRSARNQPKAVASSHRRYRLRHGRRLTLRRRGSRGRYQTVAYSAGRDYTAAAR